MVIVIGIITRLVFAMCIYSIAISKDRGGGWGFAGFFFPAICGIIVLCLKDKSVVFGDTNCNCAGRCPYYRDNLPPPMETPEAKAETINFDAASRLGIDPLDDGKWVVCGNCGERATMYYARIRKHCPHCDTVYDLEKAMEIDRPPARKPPRAPRFSRRPRRNRLRHNPGHAPRAAGSILQPRGTACFAEGRRMVESTGCIVDPCPLYRDRS